MNHGNKPTESAAVTRDREVAARFPASAEAHYNLANSLLRNGEAKSAIESYRRAVELRPTFGAAHSNCGVALLNERKFDEAKACFLRALEFEPDDALAHNNLGNAALALGSSEEAQGHFRRAIELKPEFADAVFNLGHALQLAGHLDEAAECFERTLRMQPGHVGALNNLGNIRREQHRLKEAIRCYQKAIAANPSIAELHNNLGVAYRDNRQAEQAIESFQRALTIRADYAEAWNNSGNAHKDLGLLEQAMACLQQAVSLAPREAMYYSNLGLCSLDLGQPDEAEKFFEKAMQLNPDLPHVRWSRSMLLLLRGDWERGWPEHEWRWRCPEWRMYCKAYLPNEPPQPVWDGSSLAGKTILLQAEQGLGDTIQFVRYVRPLKQTGCRVVLECQRSLVKLLAAVGADEVVADGTALPPFDVRVPLLTLPSLFKTSLASVPSEVPYLFADAELVAYWKEKLSGLLSAGTGDPRTTATRVGINWRGRPGTGVFRLRDIPLECFEPLSRLPGVRLVSLQVGAGRDDLRAASGDPRTTANIVDLGSDVDTSHGAFMDTAAIMKNLDLVITSDTAVAHLAGALAVPVWLALPYAADWRWLLDRSDSPWYPTMRLFRQTKPGDWMGVFQEIERELRTFVTEALITRGTAAGGLC